jgi:hypothetical protein
LVLTLHRTHYILDFASESTPNPFYRFILQHQSAHFPLLSHYIRTCPWLYIPSSVSQSRGRNWNQPSLCTQETSIYSPGTFPMNYGTRMPCSGAPQLSLIWSSTWNIHCLCRIAAAAEATPHKGPHSPLCRDLCPWHLRTRSLHQVQGARGAHYFHPRGRSWPSLFRTQ